MREIFFGEIRSEPLALYRCGDKSRLGATHRPQMLTRHIPILYSNGHDAQEVSQLRKAQSFRTISEHDNKSQLHVKKEREGVKIDENKITYHLSRAAVAMLLCECAQEFRKL